MVEEHFVCPHMAEQMDGSATGLPSAYLTNVLVKLAAHKSLISMVGAHGLEPWTR
jgi:hypothetical protein